MLLAGASLVSGAAIAASNPALSAARRGALATNVAELQSNQLRRCEPLPAGDREDCVARMKGHGTTSGSVAAGGIYRELVTREPVVEQPLAKDAPPR